MQKFLLLILLFSISTYANEPLTLSSPKTNLIKDENITLTLKPLHVNPKDITWIIEPKNSLHVKGLTITPKEDITITLQAKYKNKLSNKLTLHVKWIVNGHTLPPKPSEKINNSTLLGIDTNKNGVRDDVERWIYETYHHPIERGIFMQSARAYQKVIVEPKKASETMKYMVSIAHCSSYWRMSEEDKVKRKLNFSLGKYRNISKEIKPIQFNTAKRFIAYDRFNRELSGGVYGDKSMPDEWINYCEFDKNGNLK